LVDYPWVAWTVFITRIVPLRIEGRSLLSRNAVSRQEMGAIAPLLDSAAIPHN
jgi:hypothetical protein